jgi:hypothetical protein
MHLPGQRIGPVTSKVTLVPQICLRFYPLGIGWNPAPNPEEGRAPLNWLGIAYYQASFSLRVLTDPLWEHILSMSHDPE